MKPRTRNAKRTRAPAASDAGPAPNLAIRLQTCESRGVFGSLLLRLVAVVGTAYGARTTLALLRAFVTSEALRGPRAFVALAILPPLVALALVLLPRADGRLAATVLYASSPRRAAALGVGRTAAVTLFVAFVALHVALAPTYFSRPLAVASVELSLAAAFGTFATTLAATIRFAGRPFVACGVVLALTAAAELLARTTPVGDVASAWLSPVRSLVLQLLAFDARPSFVVALPLHTALASLVFYPLLSPRSFSRLAERSLGAS